ncbi:hypothetical protein BCR35DRAFT_302118, partial [Leucosporidium creatinivorum]
MVIALDPSSLEEPTSPVKAPTTDASTASSLLPAVTITTASASPSAPSTTTVPFPGSPLKRKLSWSEPQPEQRPRLEEFEESDDPFLNAESTAFKAAKSARQWNGLLHWARRARGPQWDWGTATYHVDMSSPEYFAGVTRVAASALPAHVVPSAATSTTDSTPGTPANSSGAAGFHDSGRPKRSRAAMG